MYMCAQLTIHILVPTPADGKTNNSSAFSVYNVAYFIGHILLAVLEEIMPGWS